jgi:hypothetical protein
MLRRNVDIPLSYQHFLPGHVGFYLHLYYHAAVARVPRNRGGCMRSKASSFINIESGDVET